MPMKQTKTLKQIQFLPFFSQSNICDIIFITFFSILQVNSIPGIEEVNMIKDDGTVIHFNNPKVQASLAANTFAVTGHGENKQITDLLPGILNQLGAESLQHLKKLASNVPTADGVDGTLDAGKDDDDDDVPDLVENFDEASKNESNKDKSGEGNWLFLFW